jgi:hypothetical protein
LQFSKIFNKNASIDLGEDGYDEFYGNGALNQDALKESLEKQYSLFVTKREGDKFTVYNVSENDINATFVCVDENVKSKKIIFRSKTETEFNIGKAKKSLLWQKSIFDMVWIKKGDKSYE